ncbi:DUF6455 family protein, partial [Cribrihabitans sp. XS_ASV171]
HHAGLVDRMANTLGLDLDEAALRGELAIDEISDAVLSCTACTNPDHCSGWLGKTQQAEQAPGYCRNQTLFARLAP